MDTLSELRASMCTVFVWKLESTSRSGVFIGEASISIHELSHTWQGNDVENDCILATRLIYHIDRRCRSMGSGAIG